MNTGKIITVSTFKGGAGKTTITSNLASCLAINNPNKKICILDLDPQSNINLVFGRAVLKYKGCSVLSFLENERILDEIIFNDLKNEKGELIPNLFLIPCEPKFSFYDYLFENPENIKKFKNFLETIKSKFDYIIVDTHPNISKTNSLTFLKSELLILPFIPNMSNVFGVLQIIDQAKSQTQKPDILVLGNQVRSKANLHNEVLEYFEGVIELDNKNTSNMNLYFSNQHIPNLLAYDNATNKKKIPLYLLKSNAKNVVSQREIFDEICSQIFDILEHKAL